MDWLYLAVIPTRAHLQFVRYNVIGNRHALQMRASVDEKGLGAVRIEAVACQNTNDDFVSKRRRTEGASGLLTKTQLV